MYPPSPVFDDLDSALSNGYYQGLERDEDGSFEARVIGRFYTPNFVASQLAQGMLRELPDTSREISLIDPFCGDGALLVAFLSELNQMCFEAQKRARVLVRGFDIDTAAVEKAAHRLGTIAQELDHLDLIIAVQQSDTFIHPLSDLKADYCITNPPWLLLKAIGKLGNEGKSEYVHLLKEMFPLASSRSSFGTKTANLARIGGLLSLEASTPSGKCGILLPSSLLSDFESTSFRKHLWKNFDVESISFYRAGLRIFSGVDQDFVAVVASASDSSNTGTEIRHCNPDFTFESFQLSAAELSDSLGTESELPDFSSRAGFAILRRISPLPAIASHKEVRVFRELDETRIASRFDDTSEWRFIKGRDINRYSQLPDSLPRIPHPRGKMSVREAKAKIVWRDVARRSQARRVKATIVPAGVLAGNSLGCLTSDGDASLGYYLGILNSWLSELQVRALSHTNHVSTGIIKRLRAPQWDHTNILHRRISELALLKMENSNSVSEDELEALVCEAFNLNKTLVNEIEQIIAGK